MQGGQKGPSDCFKIVKMIMERQMQPVIIFSFSKRDCETHAMQMSKLDFTNGLFVGWLVGCWSALYLTCRHVSDEEKSLIDEIFSNAMEALSEDDRHLPQVFCYYCLSGYCLLLFTVGVFLVFRLRTCFRCCAGGLVSITVACFRS
jgi:superfamily II RNA helicase